MTRQAPCDFDQFADIGDTLRSVLLRHHDNVEICFANDVLENLGGGGGVAVFKPVCEKLVEERDPHPARVSRAGLSQRERQERIEWDPKKR